MESAPPSGAAGALPYLPLRRTAQPRPLVSPQPLPTIGYPLTHNAARRWWSAILGPGAVADLLRLATAARRGRSLPRPVHLDVLARAGLVIHTADALAVVNTFPPIPPLLTRQMHPLIQRERQRSRAT